MMANYSLVILDTNVKLDRGTNSAMVSTLDTSRKEQAGLTFTEHPLGVQVIREGAPFALVPWSQVRQAIYAPSPHDTRALTAALSAEDIASIKSAAANAEKAVKK